MRLPLLLFLLTLLPSLVAAKPASVPPTPVTLQLKWYHQFQFAGYYAAKAQGYYSEAGLDVTIREGSPEHDPIEDVVKGEADFGIGASELLLARSNGEPVVALAAIIQHSPLILLARQGPEVNSFRDLVGKRLEIVPHEYELFAFIQAMGYSREDFILTPRAGNLEALINGEVAAIAAYSTDEPYAMQQRGLSYLAISPRSAGIDFYGDSLFTSEQMLQQSPQTVAAFREASLKGWRYALEHPEEVAALIRRDYRPSLSLDHLLYEARTLKSLIMPTLIELGYMHQGRWEHIANTYRQLGLLRNDVELDQFLFNSEREKDYGWLYWATGAAMLLALSVILIAIYILRLNQRLKISETRYRILHQSAPLAILAWNRQRQITAWNHQAEAIFGWSAEEAIGRDFFDFMIPVDEAEHVEGLIGSIYRSDAGIGSLNWNLTKSGERILCEWMNAVVHDGAGNVSEVVALAMDVTEKVRIQQALRESEQRYRLLAENAIDVIWTMDMQGHFTYVSPSVEQLHGYSVEEALNLRLEDILTPQARDAVLHALHHLQETGELLQHEWELEQRCKDGSHVWTDIIVNVVRSDEGTPQEIVGISRDATARRRLEKKLHKLAHSDALTGLPNRTLFFDRLKQAIKLAHRQRHRVGLLFIDLDGFKGANDSYGHEFGDRLLQEVAHRLQQHVREADTVARMGGDEFTVILHRVGSRQDCQHVAEQLLKAIAIPFTFNGNTIALSASIGISLYPDDSNESESLLNSADKAMYAVKHDGKHGFRFHP